MGSPNAEHSMKFITVERNPLLWKEHPYYIPRSDFRWFHGRIPFRGSPSASIIAPAKDCAPKGMSQTNIYIYIYIHIYVYYYIRVYIYIYIYILFTGYLRSITRYTKSTQCLRTVYTVYTRSTRPRVPMVLVYTLCRPCVDFVSAVFLNFPWDPEPNHRFCFGLQ